MIGTTAAVPSYDLHFLRRYDLWRLRYAAEVSIPNSEAMGWLRALVGVALVVAPGAPMRLSGQERPTGASLLLMRTIGIRDLVLGLGSVVAARYGEDGDGGRWNSAALASDSLDTVVSIASFRSIGKRDALAAAALAAAFVWGDLRARRSPNGTVGHRMEADSLGELTRV